MLKTFNELTSYQQTAAIDKCLNSLLEDVINGTIRFNDALNHDDLQARIDAAFAKAEKMQTPWFAGDYVIDTCGDDLRGMAECDAMDALYNIGHEYRVIDLPGSLTL